MRRELLNSVNEAIYEYDLSLNETGVAELKDAITSIQKYEDKNTKLPFSLVTKQGCLCKNFKHSEQLFELVGLNKLTAYFKINLHKFISKHPVLRRSTLSSHYLKNNLKTSDDVMNYCCFFLLFSYRENFSSILRIFILL